MFNPNLVAIWPDGVYCHGAEVEQYQWKSDDYILVDLENAAQIAAYPFPEHIETIYLDMF